MIICPECGKGVVERKPGGSLCGNCLARLYPCDHCETGVRTLKDNVCVLCRTRATQNRMS